jgi:hypothetical protein
MILRVRCGWCGRKLGIKFIGLNGFKNWFKISHGLCEGCKEKIIESVKKAGDKQLLTERKK